MKEFLTNFQVDAALGFFLLPVYGRKGHELTKLCVVSSLGKAVSACKERLMYPIAGDR